MICTSYAFSFNKLSQVIYLKALKCCKRDWEDHKSPKRKSLQEKNPSDDFSLFSRFIWPRALLF